jgi:hypothetical protein
LTLPKRTADESVGVKAKNLFGVGGHVGYAAIWRLRGEHLLTMALQEELISYLSTNIVAFPFEIGHSVQILLGVKFEGEYLSDGERGSGSQFSVGTLIGISW